MKLKALAAALGLSQTTVSRALNGFPEVASPTRLRVLEAARLHNYRPNVRARGLATGRAMAIGHVIPLSGPQGNLNPVFADFIAGAGEACSAADYDMVLSVVSDADEAEAYRKLKARGTVDGVIVHGPMVNDWRIALLHDLALPFVVHGRSSMAPRPYCWVDMHHEQAFEMATQLLLDLGHRRIALINGPEPMDFSRRRRAGYQSALADQGLVADPVLMRAEEMTESYGHRAGEAMLRLPDPPTAFLTSSLFPALGVRRAIDAAGLKIGRDVSVVTHDDDLSHLRNGDDIPMFTATRSSVREAGRQAARMLLQSIADPALAPRQDMLKAELVLGQSTGPRQK